MLWTCSSTARSIYSSLDLYFALCVFHGNSLSGVFYLSVTETAWKQASPAVFVIDYLCSFKFVHYICFHCFSILLCALLSTGLSCSKRKSA